MVGFEDAQLADGFAANFGTTTDGNGLVRVTGGGEYGNGGGNHASGNLF